MNIIKKSNFLLFQICKTRGNIYAFSTSSENLEKNQDTKLKTKSARRLEFEEKLRIKMPLDKLDEHITHPNYENEPIKPWPNNVNPHTGEIGGPAGLEPTRYGDWERKGRVSDF